MAEISWTRSPPYGPQASHLEGTQHTRRHQGGPTATYEDPRGQGWASREPALASKVAEDIKPEFLSNSTVKVFAPQGGTATIECHVIHLGDRAVSHHVIVPWCQGVEELGGIVI